MAKKKTAKKTASSRKKVNKSQAIRDYRAKHPQAGPTEVSRALARRGIKVSPALVSNVASTAGGKRKKKAKTVRRKSNGAVGGESVRVADLVAAQQFVERVGGIDSARMLLKAIETLSR